MTYFVIALFSTVVWIAKGHYDPSAFLLVLSFFLWVYLTVKPQHPWNQHLKTAFEARFYHFWPWAGAVMMAIKPNLIYVLDSFKPLYVVYRFLPSAIFFSSKSNRAKSMSEWVFAIAILAFFLAALVLSPNPHIDVFRSNDLAVDFFLHWHNPYSQTYPDIYSGGFDYHPGFLYWPGALYLQTVSKILFRDIRVILVLAWWGSVFLFPRIHPRAKELKWVWWLLPFAAFGFEQGWLDPVLSLAAAVILWSYPQRKWWFMAIAMAFAALVKQYGFIIGIFPMVALLLDRDWKFAARAGFSAAAIFVFALSPFLVWDFDHFLKMTVTSHTTALARPDALNFTAIWIKVTHSQFPGWAQAGMSLAGFVLAFLHLHRNRAMRGLAVFPECWAIAFGFSIFFGKFAFCNYHWLLISFWILSLAFEDAGKARS